VLLHGIVPGDERREHRGDDDDRDQHGADQRAAVGGEAGEPAALARHGVTGVVPGLSSQAVR
jgi:hypothetical protein